MAHEELLARASAIGRQLLALARDTRSEEMDALLDEREPIFAEISRRRSTGELGDEELEELVALERQLQEASRDALDGLRGAMNALASPRDEAPPFVERVEGAQLLDRHA